MDALGVRRPDVLTRVVEYLPEIIAYVQVGVDLAVICYVFKHLHT
jgi:cysteinyl-tRNA synthetase